MKNLQELLKEIRDEILPEEDNLVTFVLGEEECFIEVFEFGAHIIIKYSDVYDNSLRNKERLITANLYAELTHEDLSAAYLKDIAAICELVEKNAHIFEMLLSPIDKN